MPLRLFRAGLPLALFAVACGHSSGGSPNETPRDGGPTDAHLTDGTISGGGDATGSNDAAHFGMGDGSMGPDGGSCSAPDMLIVLDHTDSMSDTPQGTKPADTDAGVQQTKWFLATQAVTSVSAAPADQTIRFGLELFPLDPAVVTDAGGTGSCRTVEQLLAGMGSTNTGCEAAEVPIAPNLGNGAAIATFLDPFTTRLCVTTPIAKALATAQTALAAVAVAGRSQYVLLVTDGGETCGGDVPAAAGQLAAAGIKTYVVGFGSSDAGAAGVNVKTLNEAACAGKTATSFATSCVLGDAGYYVPLAPKGAPLFYLAEDGPSLSTALASIETVTCCGCAQ